MKNKVEIFSPCCAFGGGTEEVHALRSECPIDRQLGQRDVNGREEVTCYYTSGLSGEVVPSCSNYQGTKKVKRGGREKYLILCKALEQLPKAPETTE